MSKLRLERLCKRYGARDVVRDLSFEVADGARFAFLGPNGSGKSTTIRMLTTLLEPSSGDAFIDGVSIRDRWSVRARIGVVFQDPSLDLRLMAFENLDFYASLYRPQWSRSYRRDKAHEVLSLVGLLDRAHDLVGTFSWGMRRRLEIARALMTDPEVLFLDEPTTGLDPQTRHALWSHLEVLGREKGITLFVATHDMEEAMRCDQSGILHEGRLVGLGTAEEICSSAHAPDLSTAFLILTGHQIDKEGSGDLLLPKGGNPLAFRRG